MQMEVKCSMDPTRTTLFLKLALACDAYEIYEFE